MIVEWNEYLNYELSILTEAFMGVVPAAKAMESEDPKNVISKPEDIARFFEKFRN